jgi:Na+/phosphate symporter
MNPAIHVNKLEETIRKQIQKSNNFDGNAETELNQWFDLIGKLICLDQK